MEEREMGRDEDMGIHALLVPINNHTNLPNQTPNS
jgi:hypothetical protein